MKLEAQLEEVNKNMTEIKNKEKDLDNKSHEVTASLSKENGELKTKVKDITKENLDLKSKMDEITDNISKLEKQVTKCEKSIADLEGEVVNKDKELKDLRSMKLEKVGLEMKIKDVERDLKVKEEEVKKGLESSKELIKLKREKENLETKVKSLEKDLANLKSREASTQVRRSSHLESLEDLRQEKRYMETRITMLLGQVEQGDSKLVEMERKIVELTKESDRVKGKLSSINEKTCLRGIQPGPTQTGLYNHRRWLEA